MDLIDQHLDAVLRASGSALRYYTMQKSKDDMRAAMRAAMVDTPTQWRCFHCDEVLTTSDAAIEHFGRTERQSPACQIDIAEYRAMEQRMLAYNEEDAEIHRGMNRRLNDHQLALVREEERGYARGLEDAKKHPADLGLMPIPAAPGVPA